MAELKVSSLATRLRANQYLRATALPEARDRAVLHIGIKLTMKHVYTPPLISQSALKKALRLSKFCKHDYLLI